MGCNCKKPAIITTPLPTQTNPTDGSKKKEN